MADKVQLIKEEIERRIEKYGPDFKTPYDAMYQLLTLLDFIDSLPEEKNQSPVIMYGLSCSVGLEDAVKERELYKEYQGDPERQEEFMDFAKFGNQYQDHNEDIFCNEKCLNKNVQYDSREAGIYSHATTYSFNIESQLFPQLTEEQQKLWRKEIENACISGGFNGLNLADDTRYDKKEHNHDLEEEVENWMKRYVVSKDLHVINNDGADITPSDIFQIAYHFAEWGRTHVENKEKIVNEDLEEEFNRFLDDEEGVPRMWHSDEQMEWGKDIAHHFAEWQRDKDAVPSCKSLYNAIKKEQEELIRKKIKEE